MDVGGKGQLCWTILVAGFAAGSHPVTLVEDTGFLTSQSLDVGIRRWRVGACEGNG